MTARQEVSAVAGRNNGFHQIPIGADDDRHGVFAQGRRIADIAQTARPETSAAPIHTVGASGFRATRPSATSSAKTTTLAHSAGVNADTTVLLCGDASNWFPSGGAWVFKV